MAMPPTVMMQTPTQMTSTVGKVQVTMTMAITAMAFRLVAVVRVALMCSAVIALATAMQKLLQQLATFGLLGRTADNCQGTRYNQQNRETPHR